MTRKNIFRLLCFAILICFCFELIPSSDVSAAPSTSVKITRYAGDKTTIISQKTVTFQWMEGNLPVIGDGTTHYYLQGPIFIDDADAGKQEQLRWNPEENTNVQEKDMGAVKGTEIRDLCELVGGMSDGDQLKIKSSDGWNMLFAYKNVYGYSPREGPMVLTWYKDGKYPTNGYTDGMRLMWFADESVNPWGIHAFGNWDWHEAADPDYWYYFVDQKGKHPTTTGLSGRYVSEIIIYSSLPPGWDVNGDHTCDMGDVEQIISQWGLSGEAGWTSEDVNQDGMVNVLDIVSVGLHWEQSW